MYSYNGSIAFRIADAANPLPSGGDQFGYSVAISGATAVVGSWEEDVGATNAGQVYSFNAATGANLRSFANPSPALNDHFGHSVAISGNTLVVGAPLDDTGATDSGQSYLFDASTGALTATLANPSPASGDNFGLNVAASSTKVFAAASTDDTQNSDSGLVYTYTTAGAFVAAINNPTPDGGDQFGSAVAAYGDTLVIGAHQDDAGGADAGNAYVMNAATGAVLQTLVNPSPPTQDFFGWATAVSGNRLAVGANLDDTGASNSGLVYLYDTTSAALVAAIANPAPNQGDNFGNAVAMSNGILAVAANSDNLSFTDDGRVFLFDAANGTLLRTLTDPSPAFTDYFGSAVAMSGNLVAVSAAYDDNGATDSGIAFVFDATTGALVSTLLNPSPAASDVFGRSISISGNLVIVGAHQDDTGAVDSGQAYVFDATTGALVATLANPSPAANDNFGTTVSISGGIAAVGAYRDDTVSTDRGQAYVFDAVTGALIATLNNPTGTGSSNFGQAVAISGDVVVVGAQNDGAQAVQSGRAFVFNTAGTLLATLNNPTPGIADQFGYSIAFDGATAVVGALRDDTQNFDQGAVYVFAPGSIVSLTAGNVSITDPAGENDRITVSRANVGGTDYLRVNDSLNPLRATTAGMTQRDANTVDVPFVSVTGSLTFNAGSGDDSFTLDFSGGDMIPDGEITFTAGTGTDTLSLTNGTTTAVTHTFTNTTSGAVTLSGAYSGLVSYSGLEPINDSLTPVDRVFNFNGGAETITVTAGVTLANRINATVGKLLEFNNLSGSLTISAGSGNDVINLNGLHAAFAASLIVNGNDGHDTVNFNADMTFAADKYLDVDLANDAVAGNIDRIVLAGNANLLLSGAGTATLKASRGVLLNSGSSLVTADGDLTIEVNQQATPVEDYFVGVDLNAGLLQTTGIGRLTLRSKGGYVDDNHGVYIRAGGSIRGGTGGTTVLGVGAGVGHGKYGVNIAAGGQLTAVGGALLVEGTAGEEGDRQVGVVVSGLLSNTGVNAGDTLTVRGFGGGTGLLNYGVLVNDTAEARITAAGGALLVEGTGGGSGSGSHNYGVYVRTLIDHTGSDPGATITVRGIGGIGTEGEHYGVRLYGLTPRIRSAAAAIVVDGVGGVGGSINAGVDLENGSSISGDGVSAAVTVRGRGGTGTTLNSGVRIGTVHPGAASITANGAPLLIEAIGGSSTSSGDTGFYLENGFVLNTGTGSQATVTVRGFGGTSSAWAHAGVRLSGHYGPTQISSAGGAVLVEGTSGNGSLGYNLGVQLGGASVITNTGTAPDAAVTVRGFGGVTAGPRNMGVTLAYGGLITSQGGPVWVEGHGGGIDSSSDSYGVEVGEDAIITSAGTGPAATVTVVGVGGNGTSASNSGVSEWRGRISSSGGALSITGTGGPAARGIVSSGELVVPNGGSMTLTADSMGLFGLVTAPGGTVRLQTNTAGTRIDLGGDDIVNADPRTLGLSDSDLDTVDAGDILIGDASSGNVVVSSNVTRLTTANLEIRSGGEIRFTGGPLTTVGGNLILSPAAGVIPAAAGIETDTGGGTVSIAPGRDLYLAINGTAVDTQYQQLNVTGLVDLTGVDLVLSGSYVPQIGNSFTIVNNDHLDDVVGRFVGLPDGGRIYNLLNSGWDSTINYRGGTGNDVVLTVVAPLPTLRVVAAAQTASGAVFALSGPAVIDGLNLYDYRDTGGASVLGPADVRLTNSAGQTIPGSLVIAASDAAFTFVATSGILPPDTYTLTIRSASNGFRRPNGELLDGDADGVAGGDFVRTFVVSAPPADTVVVSLSHFSRGPDQPVNTPADLALGLPLRINAGSQVGSLTFELRFDPGLLNVTGVNLPASAPAGSTANLTVLGAGHVRITLTFASPLAAGAQAVAYLQAAVPVSAAGRYGEREALDISAIDLRTGGGVAIPALDQDGVHANAYFGDLGRNGKYDSFDVQQASRMAVRLDTGFQQHPLLDPTILADFNGNGRIDSFDVQQLSRLALRLPVSGVAALPSPVPTTTDTDRLTDEEPPKSEPEQSAAAPVSPRSDVDGNGAVDAQDVAWAVYYFNRSESGIAPIEAQGKKLDLNGDQLFDAADVLLAVTDLNTQSASAEGEGTSTTTTDGESEEDLDSLTSLLAEDLVASRKKK